MAKITVHAGDFLKGDGSFMLGQLSLLTEEHSWLGETIALTELASVDIATEENVKKLGGTIGWGIAGAAMFGPAGLLAGLLLGGKKNMLRSLANSKTDARCLPLRILRLSLSCKPPVLTSIADPSTLLSLQD